MAIDWTTGTNALFKKLGRIVRIVEIYDAFETDIDGDIDGILNTTWAGEDLDYYTWAKTELLRIKDNMKNQLTAMREEVASSAVMVVQGELTATDAAPQLSNVDLMNRMVQRMFEDNYGVTQAGDASTTYGGTQQLVAAGYFLRFFPGQDKISQNATYLARSRKFNGTRFATLTAEVINASNRYNESMKVSCPEVGYANPGGQNWGKKTNPVTINLVPANSQRNKMRNGSFEEVEIDNLTPKQWTISNGEWGTDAQVTQADQYLASRSLEFITDTSVLKQPIPSGALKPRTLYVAAMRIKNSNPTPNDSIWTCHLDLVTPYTTIEVFTEWGGTDLATSDVPSWGTHLHYFITPDVTSGMEWRLWGEHDSTGFSLYVDELLVCEPYFFAGIPFGALPKVDLPVQGTKTSASITYNTGKFASFFGRFFNANLPFHSGGTAVNENLVA